VLARKPLDGTVASTVAEHGCGGINVDGCRIGTSKRVPGSGRRGTDRIFGAYGPQNGTESGHDPQIGRHPANVVLDETAAAMLDEQSGERPSATNTGPTHGGEIFGKGAGIVQFENGAPYRGDTGGASRFFYCAKASTAERNAGLNGSRNTWPTVKPVALMRWLVRLVTPPGGLVLDPFTGSGSTGLACIAEGARFLGLDKSDEALAIATARLQHIEPADHDAPQSSAQQNSPAQLSLL
jgi:site-specific DNA-methyltransferase (adenine-specific)